MSDPTLTGLGEFADPNLERRYQESNLDQNRRRMTAICLTTATAYFAAIAINALDFGWSAAFGWMLGWRSLVLALGLVAARLAARPPLNRHFTPVMMAYMTAIGLSETVEALLQLDAAIRPLVPMVLIIVLMYYMFIPTRLYVALIPSLLTSAIYTGAIVLASDTASGYIVDIGIFFLLTNLYGIYHDITFNRVRRKEFYTLIEQQRLNRDLKREVAIRQSMEAQLRHQAETDALTGLCNRRHFMEQFAATLQGDRGGLALMMLDIDRFKAVNDTYGHDVGDLALKHLATTVQNNLRTGDLMARLGGEEFVVLLPNTPFPKACEVAQRLCQQVERSPLQHPNGELSITVSIGIIPIAPEDTSCHCLETALKAADSALYQAKHEGRNRVVICLRDCKACSRDCKIAAAASLASDRRKPGKPALLP